MARHKGQSPYTSKKGKRQGTYWTTPEALALMEAAARRLSVDGSEVSNSAIIEYCLRTAAAGFTKSLGPYAGKTKASTYNVTLETHQLLLKVAKRLKVSASDVITASLLGAAAGATREGMGFTAPEQASAPAPAAPA